MISLRNQYEIISGSRYVSGGYMENQLHGKLSYYYNIMLKFILKTKINDNLGGYFLIISILSIFISVILVEL